MNRRIDDDGIFKYKLRNVIDYFDEVINQWSSSRDPNLKWLQTRLISSSLFVTFLIFLWLGVPWRVMCPWYGLLIGWAVDMWLAAVPRSGGKAYLRGICRHIFTQSTVLPVPTRHSVYQNADSSPSKHEDSTQCCFNVGPAPLAMGQYWNSIGSNARVCWAPHRCLSTPTPPPP